MPSTWFMKRSAHIQLHLSLSVLFTHNIVQTFSILFCLVIFPVFLNTVFRKAENITKQYIIVKSDMKQFLWR